MSQKSTIEINGKLYDASTGHLLHSEDSPKEVITIKVDKVESSPKKTHQVASHVKAHEPIRSKSLMRHGVKNPNPKTHAPRRDDIKSYKPGISRQIVNAQSIHQKKAETHSHAATQVPKSRNVLHFSAVHTRNHYVESSILRAEEMVEAAVQEVPATISKASALLDKALKEARAHEEPLLARPRNLSNHNKYRIFNKLRIDRVSI